jgi:hypothetical protein
MAEATFTYRLDNISQLYIAPELNPLSTNELAVVGQSALERVLSRHEIVSKENQIELMLLLPPDKITPNMEQQIHEAVDRFCLLKMKDNDNLRRLTRRNGFRSSLNGFIFLGICLLLSGLFASDILTFVPAFARGILSEGFTIIGRVGLWHPVEAFLYDGIPVRHQNEIYRRMREMKIVVQPQ